MNGSCASSGEMPGFPFPSRSGREPDEPLLDMILNGEPLPAEAPHDMLALADRLASLGSPAGPGEVAAMAAFSRSLAGAGVSPARGEPAHHKPARRSPPQRRAARPVRLAGGFLVVMVGLGSAAAYADVLPGPVQDFAHHVIGAPPAQVSRGRSGEHLRSTHQPGTHGPASARHAAHPAKPDAARGHRKGAKPGKPKGKARHVHRANPAKRRAAKPTNPPHPAPTQPIHPLRTRHTRFRAETLPV
jgi:hypothetical protein